MIDMVPKAIMLNLVRYGSTLPSVYYKPAVF